MPPPKKKEETIIFFDIARLPQAARRGPWVCGSDEEEFWETRLRARFSEGMLRFDFFNTNTELWKMQEEDEKKEGRGLRCMPIRRCLPSSKPPPVASISGAIFIARRFAFMDLVDADGPEDGFCIALETADQKWALFRRYVPAPLLTPASSSLSLSFSSSLCSCRHH